MSKHIVEPKSFSDTIEKDETSIRGNNYNDGKVDISSDASDSDAFAEAIMQNTALALTDPYLAPDGTYTISAYPNRETPLWKIIFSKEGSTWSYGYWAHPEVHKTFMAEMERKHEEYKVWRESRKASEEWIKASISMPPYIAQMVEFQCGYPFGSPEFEQFVARDTELSNAFWVNKLILKKAKNI